MSNPSNRKRRGRGEGGVCWREDRQCYEGSVSLGYKADGRRNRKRVFGATKKEVLEEIDRLKAEARAGAIPDAGKLTVGHLMTRWLESTRGRTAARTHEERASTVEAHVLPRLGSVPLSRVTALHVEGFYGDMARDDVAPSGARHAAKCLGAALKYAVRPLRLISYSPAAGVRLPAVARREMLCLNQQQTRALLAAATGRPCHCLVAAALGTGCRQGELLALAWDDVDFTEGTINVRRCLSRTKAHGFAYKEPKTKASRRTVSLPGFVAEALAARRAAQLRAGLIAAPVFCTSAGKNLHRADVARSLKAVIRRANCPDVIRGGPPKKGAPPRRRVEVIPDALRFHDLRHTHASLLLSQGQSLRAVAARLGHSDPAMTLRVYGHVLPGDDRALAAGMEKVVG